MQRLRTFVISMFIIYGISLVKVGILSIYNRFEYLNMVYLVYAIPYVFGYKFFLHEKETEKQDQDDNSMRESDYN
jgi:hypothetical protein